MVNNKLLEVKNISKTFKIGGLITGTKLLAVDNVSFTLEQEKPTILSIVGESGSGKTTLARMILKLVEPTGGQIFVGGKNVSEMKKQIDTFKFRRTIQPIFQNPFQTFSMRKKIDTYLYETALNLNIAKNKQEAEDVIEETLASVGLHFSSITNKYLNQFSGGELQRISIARAMIPQPRVIVADEPVSMIDASMRMNIVNLFMELRQKYQCSFIYITHDLSTAYHVSDVTTIMYQGSMVEYGDSEAILTDPFHPYTELLLDSIPIVGKKWSDQTVNIPESTVEIQQKTATCCKFADRCPYVQDICRQHIPPVVDMSENRSAACFKLIDYHL